MTRNEISVGGKYEAKLGSRWVGVTILGPAKTGWNAVSDMGKPVRVKDAKQLRPAKEAATEMQQVDDERTTPPPVPTPEVVAVEQVAPRAKRAKPKPATAATTADKPDSRANGPMTCLDAAAAVLREGGAPMQTRAMVAVMKERNLWTTNAPTPAATLYSAILREMKVKGTASRFVKTGRGHFGLNT